jgi:hypothetical protein
MENCYTLEFDYSFTGDKSEKTQSASVKKALSNLSTKFRKALKEYGFKGSIANGIRTKKSLTINQATEVLNKAALVLQSQGDKAAIAKLNIILRKEDC